MKFFDLSSFDLLLTQQMKSKKLWMFEKLFANLCGIFSNVRNRISMHYSTHYFIRLLSQQTSSRLRRWDVGSPLSGLHGSTSCNLWNIYLSDE